MALVGSLKIRNLSTRVLLHAPHNAQQAIRTVSSFRTKSLGWGTRRDSEVCVKHLYFVID
jgi:hypothetical protein